MVPRCARRRDFLPSRSSSLRYPFSKPTACVPWVRVVRPRRGSVPCLRAVEASKPTACVPWVPVRRATRLPAWPWRPGDSPSQAHLPASPATPPCQAAVTGWPLASGVWLLISGLCLLTCISSPSRPRARPAGPSAGAPRSASPRIRVVWRVLCAKGVLWRKGRPRNCRPDRAKEFFQNSSQPGGSPCCSARANLVSRRPKRPRPHDLRCVSAFIRTRTPARAGAQTMLPQASSMPPVARSVRVGSRMREHGVGRTRPPLASEGFRGAPRGGGSRPPLRRRRPRAQRPPTRASGPTPPTGARGLRRSAAQGRKAHGPTGPPRAPAWPPAAT